MEEKQLPKNIAAEVQAWLGDHSVLHFWTCCGTYFINVKRAEEPDDLYCLRIFPLGGSLELSQDNIIYG